MSFCQEGDDEEDEDADKNGFNDDVWKSFSQPVFANNLPVFGFFGKSGANSDLSTQEVRLLSVSVLSLADFFC